MAVHHKAAIYCRLSEEDRYKDCKGDDSESIKNQKLMLSQYAADQGWDIYHVYSDDDFTGSDRNRPDFNRLLKDAEDGKFNIVLCKTQSRFTRELEIVEKYIHYLFPLWGIRFVSIVDNADTSVKGNKKSRQINGLINEWYLEDMSENIKAVLTNRRKNGFFIGAFAPYGYKKDPDKKGHLIIDEPAAKIVRRIFDLYLSGMGRTSIARQLNSEGILSPAGYKRSEGYDYKNQHNNRVSIWRDFTISNILNNEVYIGNLVQNKTHSISYKTKILKPTPKEEWIRAEGTHDPIIDINIWNKAQNIILKKSSRSSPHSGKPDNFLYHKLFCSVCGGSLTRCKKSKKYGENGIYYRCSTRKYDAEKCTGSNISQKLLYSAVLGEIKKHIEQLADINYIENNINLINNYQQRIEDAETTLFSAKERYNNIAAAIKNLYIDKAKGIITEEMYLDIYNSLKNDSERFSKAIDITQKKIYALKQESEKNIQNNSIIKKYLDRIELDFEIVHILIDKIVVHPVKPYSRETNIEIFWNF